MSLPVDKPAFDKLTQLNSAQLSTNTEERSSTSDSILK